MNTEPDQIFPIFFGTWIVLGILGLFLFGFKKDVRFKRKWFPRFIIFVGFVFIMFIKLMGTPNEVFYLVIPAVILISFLNIHFTKFCTSCGKTLYHYNWFTKMKFCSSCGAKLNNDKETPN